MRLPALPPTVRIVPLACKTPRMEGNKIVGHDTPADAPVFICKPLGAMETAGFSPAIRENNALGLANVAISQLVTIENLSIGDEPFDRKNSAHIAALDLAWLMDVGSDLVTRAYFTDEELGKSPLPSD